MMTFLSALDEEGFLTYEVSDDVLETAGENNIAGNYTLASCTGLSVCPGLTSARIGGTRAKHFPELDQPDRYRRTDRGMSSPPKLE